MLRHATDWNEYVNHRFEHSEHIPFVYIENPLRSTSEFIDDLRRSVDCYTEHGTLHTEIVQLREQDNVPTPEILRDARRMAREVMTTDLKRRIKDFEEWLADSRDKHDRHSSEVSQELTDFLLSIMGGDPE